MAGSVTRSLDIGSLERVDHFEEAETVKIGVVGDDATDAVFAHEDGGVRIVEEAPPQDRHLIDHDLGRVKFSTSWAEPPNLPTPAGPRARSAS